MAFNINPRYMYASERRLLPTSAPDFDLDAGEESGSIAALDLAQGRKPKPVAAPQPAPALPDIQPPARPGPVSRVTTAYDTHTPLPGAEPEPELRDYRNREIGDMSDFQRDQFVRGGPTDAGGRPKRSIKDVILNALSAFGAASQANPRNPLAAIAGGITAGVGTAMNPRGGREYRFETTRRPMIEADETRKQQRQARFLAGMKTQLELEEKRVEIEKSRAEQDKLRADIGRMRDPRQTQQPQLRLGKNRQSGELRSFNALDPEQAAQFEPYQFPAQERPRTEPKPPTAAELTVDPESGMSVEEMSDASYQARGGDRYVFDRLPARSRQILSAGTVMVKGKEQRATQAEMDVAQKEFERAIERQQKTDKEYTGGAIRRKRLGATKAPGATTTQPTAQRKAVVGADFVKHVASQLGITPEEARRRIEADGYTVR